MIHQRYEEAFRSLTPEELDHLIAGLAASRPELHELGDFESGQELLDYCRQEHISQAEVIMSVRNDPSPVAVRAVERIIMRPIDRRTPSEVERQRDAERAAKNPAPAPKVATIGAKDRIADQRVIRLLVDKNPKREGTKAHDRFALYKDGLTVGEFLKKSGTHADIAWDQDRGFVRLDPPESL